jgi:hypothetical protein
VLPEAWGRYVASVSPQRRRRASISLIDAVARLFAVGHECGFVHRDAHPNNVLVRSGPDGAYEAAFVDVHAAAVTRGPAPARRAIRALAQLDHFFRRLATRTERLRFLRAYAAHRASNGGSRFAEGSERGVLGMVAATRAAHAVQLARQRDRRLRRNGKYFSGLVLGDGWRATAALALERRHLFPEADVPDRTAADWRELLQPALKAVAEGQPPDQYPVVVGVRFEVDRPIGLIERLEWTLRGSPSRRVFERCHRQRHRDHPADLALAYAEHRRAGVVNMAFLALPDRPERGPDQGRCDQGA